MTMTDETATVPTSALTTEPPAQTPEPTPTPTGGESKTLESVLYPKDGAESPPVAAAAEEPKTESESPKVETEAPKEEGAKSEPAPLTADSYKDLTLPEGLVVNDALFAEAKEVLAKVGVDPAKAPELMALYGKVQTQQAESIRAEIKAQDTAWSKELDAIPEFSGEQRAVASQFIGRAIEEFGTPEVRQTLAAYGLGNNPALARFIYNMAYAIVEGERPLTGGAAPVVRNGSPKPSLAESLYDHPDSAKARTQ